MKFLGVFLASLAVVLVPATASAHVAVNPATVGVGSSSIFTISVPNESQQPMTNFALAIPTGLIDVTPTAQAGWTIITNKSGDALTKISWTDGSLLPGQRQAFTFSAQAPATAKKLEWKAYQTFADGSAISWDQKPTGSDDATGNRGPFSVTNVVDDIAPAAATKSNSNNLTLVIAGAALLLSIYTLLFKKQA